MKKIQILTCLLILAASLALSGCKKKSAPAAPTPTPAPKLVDMAIDNRPYISLIPRADGHELKLKINRIPDNIAQIEYELIYNATDGVIEMEKGVGDTLKIESATIEKDLLLGTASCTNGCKYKYDEGITGGTLSLSFLTQDGQMSTFETPFILLSSDQINQKSSLALADLTITATANPGQFFTLLQNYGRPNPAVTANTIYSIFASGNGGGKVNSISPDTITKENLKTLAGDYLAP